MEGLGIAEEILHGADEEGRHTLVRPFKHILKGENVLLSEKGYNRHRINIRQINFAMAFSSSDSYRLC
ncbi:MAG: hypothetical protein ACP5UO_05095 [Thermoplasmata archaeon]